MWRKLQRTEIDLFRQAAAFEREFPTFYRDAANTWTATEEEFLFLFESFEYVYGIFDRSQLIGVLYFQRITDTHKAVHLSMKRGADKNIVLEGCIGVRNDRMHNGTKSTETWVLTRNRAMRLMVKAIGFRSTGLEMRSGSSHGKVLKWAQFAIRNG